VLRVVCSCVAAVGLRGRIEARGGERGRGPRCCFSSASAAARDRCAFKLISLLLVLVCLLFDCCSGCAARRVRPSRSQLQRRQRTRAISMIQPARDNGHERRERRSMRPERGDDDGGGWKVSSHLYEAETCSRWIEEREQRITGRSVAAVARARLVGVVRMRLVVAEELSRLAVAHSVWTSCLRMSTSARLVEGRNGNERG
jgi:hypothetical protein